jgi:xanthine dehydrogenase/oxidase
MEGQVAVCNPIDDGYEVHSSTQWLDLVRQGVAQLLKLNKSSFVTVKTKQLGGGPCELII